LLKKTLQFAIPLLFGSAIMVWVYRDFDFQLVIESWG
ncbi:UPF0104 family protein, partial [Bacteroides sp. 51]|nr:UPF0104 family protein [Bacteroides sp. 51]